MSRPSSEAWPVPSPEVAELIRTATTRLLVESEPLFDEIDAAVLAIGPGEALADPQAAAAIRASTRANLTHWASANLAEPGARVPPHLGPEVVELGREIVRRGIEDTSLQAYHVSQNIAWRRWMRTAFQLGATPDRLQEMLDITARSIFAFVDDTVAALQEAMRVERAQLVSRTHTERLEIVSLILEHAPITAERASARLRYELGRRHTAAIVWSDTVGPRDPGELEAASDQLARAVGAARPLTVAPSASTLWVWASSSGDPDLGAVRSALRPSGGVSVAIGTTSPGIDGFRRSHLHALATQRLMRRAGGGLRVAGYSDVQLAALVAAEEESTAEFVAATLGELASADPALRDTLRTYIREGFSSSRTARTLFAHRNTVQGRLRRAEQLLPVTLPEQGLEVGLALEILHWLGPAVLRPTS